MHRGYVKLWRKALDSGLMGNCEAWAVWTYILLSATHAPHRHLIGAQFIDLQPGQVIVGRKMLAQRLGLTERKIRTCLVLLEKLENVTIKTTNKFSIITVKNWAVYQSDDQQTTSRPTSTRPANDQQTTTNKKEKNEKNKKEASSLRSEAPDNSPDGEPSEPSSKTYPPEYHAFVEGFAAYVVQEHGKKAPKVTPALLNQSLDAVDKLIRIDGFDLDTVKAVMRWAVKDEFWARNALSLAGIRKKGGDGTTKFQKILAAFEQAEQHRHGAGTNKPPMTLGPRDARNFAACREFLNRHGVKANG